MGTWDRVSVTDSELHSAIAGGLDRIFGERAGQVKDWHKITNAEECGERYVGAFKFTFADGFPADIVAREQLEELLGLYAVTL